MIVRLKQLIVFLMVSIIILFGIYWSGDYYKYDKFRVFLTLLSAIAVIFGILAIVIQGLNYNDTVKQRDSESFANLTKQFIHETLLLFIQNPDMEYYYNDLLGIRHITKNTKRNMGKEHKISMLIYAKLASIVYYVQVNEYNLSTKGIISRTNNILNTYFKSKVFKGYWHDYDVKLAGDPIRIYLKKHFNMSSSVLKN
jgi:hypothetical protein